MNPVNTIKSSIATLFDPWFQQELPRISQTLIDLINIETVTPNEALCFPLLEDYLRNVGFSVKQQACPDTLAKHPAFSPHPMSCALGRSNLHATMYLDSQVQHRLLFNCHVDVVPATDAFPNAFTASKVENCIIGRGACDTKNNLIMLVEAIRFLQQQNIKLNSNVTLDLTIEEEIGGNGTLATIIKGIDTDEVIVLEPTGLQVFRGHRGCLTFQIDVRGRAVHMGGDDSGVSAIEGAMSVISSLRLLEAQMLKEAKSCSDFACWQKPLQLNIGIIHGGEWIGSVPEHCTIQGNLGFLPTYSIQQVEKHIINACKSVPNTWIADHVNVRFDVGLRNEAYVIDHGTPLVADLLKSINQSGLTQKKTYAWKVSCDARHYSKLCDLPVVIFGCGSLEKAHSAHESIDLAELQQGAQILAHFLSTERSV